MDTADLHSPKTPSAPEAQDNQPEKTPVTIAPCGMNCTECRFAIENDCPGCMNGRVFDDEDCEILDCCMKKGCTSCRQCRAFPCGMLKAVSFETETGDGGARLMRLKAIKDSEKRTKRRKASCTVLGLSLGAALGAIIGELNGSSFVWLFTCILAGTALGIIAGISGRNK